MTRHASPSHGFTLVELAIVLMIIGLLIGGILKGQELITNARITSAIRQWKNYDAATLTFLDTYGAFPGDIANPGTRLPNCSTAPCNVAGDGNGSIGITTAWIAELSNFWMHLGVANMIGGINTSATWGVAPHLDTNVFPASPIGGVTHLFNYGVAVGVAPTLFPYGIFGHHYYLAGISTAGVISAATPISVYARLDRKIDDGNPYRGDFKINGAACGITAPAAEYTISDTNCNGLMRTGF